MKKVQVLQKENESHWVGDGFPVRTVFSYTDLAPQVTPFLLLDYAGPKEFKPAPEGHRRGVGEHPHRGFETVTIVFEGEVEHRDSSGGGGQIGPGDVQWMTAAAGLVHEEFHGTEFSKTGGNFHMVQLWVNLPARNKWAPPAYQGITNAQIPVVELPEGAGSLRVIAGEYAGSRGPARTFTPMNVWDVKLKAGAKLEVVVPSGHTASVFVMQGNLVLQRGGETLAEAELAVLEREGDRFVVQATQDTQWLFLGGEPIDEPIVGYGPFVMNTQAEIHQALLDYRAGKMGRLSPRK